MEFDIIAKPDEIDFAPENEVKEIIQNVRTICTTPKYSVPLDRLFGINAEIVDQPSPKALAEIQSDIVQSIRKYEPRCTVKKISFEGDSNGQLFLKVRIIINE